MDRLEKGPHVISNGMLAVGDGHHIYWEEWGNPDGIPVMSFHGGPGGGFSDSHKLLLNPQKHRGIFFDQRGSGRSTPFASTKNNTTQKLVEDADKLRAHLGIEKMYLIGGSWGSTMVLNYAIAYPDRTLGMVAWGIYLGSDFENNLIANGYAKYNYPEAWEQFISLVPESHQKNGDTVTQYYASKMDSQDQAEAYNYAENWALWESSILSLHYDKQKEEMDMFGSGETVLALSKLECHYFLNHCFMPENYILDNLEKIKHIPLYVVQGRFDFCTPPITAYKLSKAYGENMTLQFVNAGHRRSDPEAKASIITAVNSNFRKIA